MTRRKTLVPCRNNPMHDNFNRPILVMDDNRVIHDDFRKILSPKAQACMYGEYQDPRRATGPEPDSQ
jgi:hypothetical protein